MNNTRYTHRILSRLPAYASLLALLLPVSFLLLILPVIPTGLRVPAGLIFFLALLATAWLIYCHRTFSYSAGRLEGKLLADLPGLLPTDLTGDLLDVGTDTGYLACTCARLFPGLRVIGLVDTVNAKGGEEDRCRANAAAEVLTDRVAFTGSTLTNLPFAADSFDAVISGYAFRHVKNDQARRIALMEALRVCKAGGQFVFQDFFGREDLYGDVNELVAGLRAAGLKEIHYLPNLDQADFVPAPIQIAGILRGAGLIYGTK